MTSLSPAALFLGRELRTRLSLLRPQPVVAVPQSEPADVATPRVRGEKVYQPGDTVFARLSEDDKWEPAVILSRNGNVTYVIKLNGQARYCHRDMLRACPESLRPVDTEVDTPRRGRPPILPVQPSRSLRLPSLGADPQSPSWYQSPSPSDLPASPSQETERTPPESSPRRSQRERTAPRRLEYSRSGSPSQ